MNAETTSGPINLLTISGGYYAEFSVDYHQGLRSLIFESPASQTCWQLFLRRGKQISTIFRISEVLIRR